MSTSETFSNWYSLHPSGNNTVMGFYGAGAYTVNDSQDGNDGQTAVGGSVHVVESNYNYTLVGTTANGIVVSNSFGYYLFTNGSYNINDTLSVNTVDPYTYCFLEGTQIQTPEGERSVESLQIGDTVLSADGRELTVRWMGHEKVRNGIGASVHKAPVKISAGAFGNGLPERDLYVSNAHAFLLDGHLVVASALINDDTITSVPFSELPSEFTYWHIETDEHELVVANGVAAETLSGAPERKDFDNYDSYIAAFGADRIIQPMSYPRIKDVTQMPQSLIERFNLQQAELDWESLLSDSSASVVLKQAGR